MTQIIKGNTDIITSPSPLVEAEEEMLPSPFRGRVGVGVALVAENNPHPNLPPERGKEFYEHQPRDQKLKAHSRRLRKDMTDVEKKLWSHLRYEQLGVKFRRQYPMGTYIPDFVCLEQKLIIELDGGQHATQQDYDQKRDAFFKDQGFRMLRFWNNEVLGNMEGVLQVIFGALFTPLPNPLPQGERE
jgi:very-short-patch-repair endonuclease